MAGKGFIYIHRKMLDNPIICKDSDYLAVWVYLLLNATHDEVDSLFEGKRITLKKGQLITGRKSISLKLNVDENKVHRILKSFENEQQIEQQTSNKNRLITVLKWDLYQNSKQQNEQEVNNNRTTSEQQVNTNNNDNNVNNEIKELKPTVEEWFETFWKLYPKKVQRRTSEQKFRLYVTSQTIFDTIINDLRIRTKSYDWTKDNGQFVPNPTTYLNQRRWEDELPKQTAPNKRVDVVPDYSKNTFQESGITYDEAMKSVNELKEKELTEQRKQEIKEKLASLRNKERE